MTKHPDPEISGQKITVTRSGHRYEFMVVFPPEGPPGHLVPLDARPDDPGQEFFSEAWQAARAAAKKAGLLP